MDMYPVTIDPEQCNVMQCMMDAQSYFESCMQLPQAAQSRVTSCNYNGCGRAPTRSQLWIDVGPFAAADR